MVVTRGQAAASTAPALRARARKIRQELGGFLHRKLEQDRRAQIEDFRLKLLAPQAGQQHEPCSPFPFMSLPAELRVRIYEYALAEPSILFLDVCKVPPLACVSRQVRREAVPVFLKTNAFHTLYCRQADGTFGSWFATQTLSWLRVAPLEVPLIRELTVDTQPERDGLCRKVSFLITADGGRPRIHHQRMHCPMCPSDGYARPLSDINHKAIPPKLREAVRQIKDSHDYLLDVWARIEWPDHNAAGLSISQIINFADALTIKPDDDLPGMMTQMSNLVATAHAYGEAIHNIIKYAEFQDFVEQSYAAQTTA